ncbi:hypothetical protein [Chryseobacterium sp.]|uniref:hypothetical protein n=1 Tax=Chryseobacterium sp. TaxID=1871047 RepID=UPI00289BF38D|nr:hypothetical protein [Chryseobacterium sp.]
MKSKIILSLFIVFSVMFSAQNTDQQNITKSFSAFLNQLKNKQIDQAVEGMYPKFFTVVPKDQMKMVLNMTYNNPIMKVEILSSKVNAAEKPELIDGEYFSLIDYAMRIRFNAETMNDEMRNSIKNMLVQKYGQGNVMYYKNEMAYYINAKSKAYAISKDKKNWKFLMVEKEMKSNLAKVLPKKILDTL